MFSQIYFMLQYSNKVQNNNVGKTFKTSSSSSCGSCSFVFPVRYFSDLILELTTDVGAPQPPQVTCSRTSLSLPLGHFHHGSVWIFLAPV